LGQGTEGAVHVIPSGFQFPDQFGHGANAGVGEEAGKDRHLQSFVICRHHRAVKLAADEGRRGAISSGPPTGGRLANLVARAVQARRATWMILWSRSSSQSSTRERPA